MCQDLTLLSWGFFRWSRPQVLAGLVDEAEPPFPGTPSLSLSMSSCVVLWLLSPQQSLDRARLSYCLVLPPVLYESEVRAHPFLKHGKIIISRGCLQFPWKRKPSWDYPLFIWILNLPISNRLHPKLMHTKQVDLYKISNWTNYFYFYFNILFILFCTHILFHKKCNLKISNNCLDNQ